MGALTRIRTSNSSTRVSGRPTGDTAELEGIERAGGISVYVGEDYLFRDDVNCCLKTIRLT
jgi:hypothetical protein